MFKELRKVGVLTNRFPVGKQVIKWYCIKCRKEVGREDIKCPYCGYNLIDLEKDNSHTLYTESAEDIIYKHMLLR